MSKKIIISDEIETKLIKLKLNESFYIDGEKVLIIKKFLDNNFVRSSIDDINSNGYPIKQKMFGMKNANGDIVNNMTQSQLFYMLQDKFKTIYNNKEQRDKLIRQVIKDWYNNKISKEGMLSVNSY